MLLKSNITSIESLSDEWFNMRLAKFTSSRKYLLMGEKGISQQGISYIRSRVGEQLTGITSDKDIDNDSTRWGSLYEPDATRKFGEIMKLNFLVTQKLIHKPGTRFSSTPDALWVKSESIDKLSYQVSTLEVKCFPTYDSYIEVACCSNPAELKKVRPDIYWQVLDQMDKCDCLKGYAGFFHPLFKIGNYRLIEFNKIELAKDFKLLHDRDDLAVKIFDEIRTKLLNIKNNF